MGLDALPAEQRVLLVVPRDLGWVTALCEAIFAFRGAYPLLVQTEEHRAEQGSPGPLRVLDMEIEGPGFFAIMGRSGSG